MFEYLEFRSIWLYLLFLGQQIIASGALHALGLLTLGLLLGLAGTFVLLLLRPRLVEDYVRIYHWYVNSDFFLIFEEKVDVRFVFKLVGLPILLPLLLLVSMINLVVRTAYHMAYRLDLLRCVNCHAVMAWQEGTVPCHLCGEAVHGPAVKSCPGCGFKPNAVRCPYCGYLVFLGLPGQPASGRAALDKGVVPQEPDEAQP